MKKQPFSSYLIYSFRTHLRCSGKAAYLTLDEDTDEFSIMIPAHPLQWPALRERTKNPGATQYAITLVTAYEYALKQLTLLGAQRIVISSNAVVKANGLPSAKQPKVIDTESSGLVSMVRQSVEFGTL